MEVIVVGLVVVGAEHYIEEIARFVPQDAEERRAALTAPLPIISHRNLLPVRQDES